MLANRGSHMQYVCLSFLATSLKHRVDDAPQAQNSGRPTTFKQDSKLVQDKFVMSMTKEAGLLTQASRPRTRSHFQSERRKYILRDINDQGITS